MYGMLAKIALNNCGRLNLTTGKNRHFNVLTDWADDADASITVVNCDDGYGIRLIGGFGGVGDVGERVELFAGGLRFMSQATVCETFPATAEGMATIRERFGANSINFSTLD